MSRAMRKGFTLIELLVVVAIISVLITILLPSVNRARVAANRTKCGAVMKQWANALHSYQSVNDGWIILSGDGKGNGNWASTGVLISPYLGTDENQVKVRYCPMYPVTGPVSKSGYRPVAYVFHEGYNSNIQPDNPAVADFKFSNCNHASSYLVMMDGMPENPGTGTHYVNPNNGKLSTCSFQVHDYQFDVIAALQAPKPTAGATHLEGQPMKTYLSGIANTMFLDGHVEQDASMIKIGSLMATLYNKGGEDKLKTWSFLKWPPR